MLYAKSHPFGHIMKSCTEAKKPFFYFKKYSGFLFMHFMILSVSVGHAWSFSYNLVMKVGELDAR